MEKVERKEQKRPVIAQELWFREDEKGLIERKEITTTVRAGDRTLETENPKGGYLEGGFITLKIQREDGGFDPLEAVVVPHSVQKKRLEDIQPLDLEGTPPETKTKSELIEKLKRLYGREFTDDDIVTIVRFEYVDALENPAIKFLNEIGSLIENDILRLKDGPFELSPEYKPPNPGREIMQGKTVSLIIGENPSGYSVSPLMWNAEYKVRGGNEIFLPVDISVQKKENLRKLLEKAVGAGSSVLRVLTITNPYKVESLEYFRELKGKYPEKIIIQEDAERIGATNQILIGPDNRFYVINSDGRGMLNSIEQFLKESRRGELKDKRIALVGAGGAARGIAYEIAKLLNAGVGELIIFNRTSEKARQLAEELSGYFPKLKISARPLDDLIILAGEQEIFVSSITQGDPLLDYGVYSLLPRGTLVVDANYGTKSVLKTNAQSQGRNDLNVHDGSGMVVEGYIIPSRKLAKLWGYEVPQGVYNTIGKFFGYKPKR